MNGLQYLLGTVFSCECEFGSIEGFTKRFKPYFKKIPFKKSDVYDKLNYIISNYNTPSTVIDNQNALELLLANDCIKIKKTLSNINFIDPEEEMHQYRDKFHEELKSLGLEFAPPEIFILDKFPQPYNNMDWSAMSPDGADYRDYGIAPGNYFKKDYLYPIRSYILLAHEMIHYIIGQINPEWLGRGLEEGIAVLLGELYLGSRVISSEQALIYSRYMWQDYRATKINKTYIEYARLAGLIYKYYGLDGIIELVKKGRPLIKKIEKECLINNFHDLNLPKGNWNINFTKLVDSFLLSVSSVLVVSPLARLVANFTEVGKTISDISKESGISKNRIEQGLDELQGDIFVTVYNNDRIDYSDTSFLIEAGALKYDII